MSIVKKIAKSTKLRKTASLLKSSAVSAGKFAWQESGAEKVPIIRASRIKAQNAIQRRKDLKEQKEAEDNKKAPPKETNTEKNRKANKEATEDKSGTGVTVVSGVPDEMVKDIRAIREIAEDSKKSGSGGLIESLLGAVGAGKGGSLFKKVLSKLPGLGALAAGAGAAGAGALKLGGFVVDKGASLFGKAASAISGIPGISSPGEKLTTVAKDATKSVSTMGKGAIEAGKGAATTVGKGAAKAGEGILGTAGKMAAKVGKAGGKSLLKKIPLLGGLAGLGFAASRAMDGDWTGAGMEAASGLASTIPGIGTAASLGIDASLAARDYMKAGDTVNDGETTRLVIPEKNTQKVTPPTAIEKSQQPHVETGLKTLQNFASNALDPDRGIFVRVVKDALKENSQNDLAVKGQNPFARVEPYNGGSQPPLGDKYYSTNPPLRPGTSDTESIPQRPTVAPVYRPGKGGKGGKFNGFGADVDSHIKEASQKYGMDERMLRGFVKMEGGWNGEMSPTGAIGTGQFIKSTWDGLADTKEGQDIGMTRIGDKFRTPADPRYDKKVNTMATALLAKKNAEMLKKHGIVPTGENLYMMHNIGPGVIPALKGGDVSDKTLKAMQQNGMQPGQSPSDFVAMQKAKFNAHYDAANSSPEENIKKASYQPSQGGNGSASSYITPYDGKYRISSEMDMARKHPVTGVVRPHKGVDVAMPSGTALKAMADGIIEKIGNDPKGYGNYLDIRHNDGTMARYAHLTKTMDGLEKGMKVSQGQDVAVSGNTGLGTGAHLHMEFRNAKGELQDFRKAVAESKDTVLANVKKTKEENNNLTPMGENKNNSDILRTNVSKADASDKAANAPVVVPVPTGGGQQKAAVSGGGGLGSGLGHTATRNNDSSIRRITDTKMGYSMA